MFHVICLWLLLLCGSTSPNTRERATRALRWLADYGAVPTQAWTFGFHHKDPEIRARTKLALGEEVESVTCNGQFALLLYAENCSGSGVVWDKRIETIKQRLGGNFSTSFPYNNYLGNNQFRIIFSPQ